MITAPFNFVPLNEKVFFPSWSEDVSHDTPFEDGESGCIDITITAKSPIFVKDSAEEEKFCQHNGEYYIPSSSVKGAVRNVLEIMSFSKLSEDFFTDNTYAVRDLANKELYMSKMRPERIFCGWLKKEKDNYIIEDCGKAGRIKHEEIDKIFNIDFASKFKKGKFKDKADDKTALKKYEMIKSDNFRYPFTHTTTSTVGEKRYALDKSSSQFGTIVLTGQPSGRDETRKIPSGKVYEFVFFEKKSDIVVDKEIIENFLFAYFHKRTTEPKESPDWTYWKEKLNNGEKVPVFFQKDGNKIAHFGLSYLYKLPYKHSVKDGISQEHFEEQLDLAQTIFGYAKKSGALKGRVQFSHFKAISNIKELEKRTEILGTPRASYYPIYVKQKGKLFTTFMDEFEIAGRKRYPIHKGSKTVVTKDTGNEKVGTTFKPLQEGAVFKGKLRYHNIKKAELGAILSALTFHNTPNTFYNIGMAKSLGYGKIELKIDNIDNISSYLKEFELYISEQISNWKNSEQLQELLTMATEQNNSGESELKYLPLEEFSKNKVGDNKDYLRRYTKPDNIVIIKPNSLITSEDLENLELKNKEFEKLKEERKEEEKREEQRQIQLQIVLNTDNTQIIKNFILNYPNDKNIKDLEKRITEIEASLKEDKHKEVDKNVSSAWEAVCKKKGTKTYPKEIEKFIAKWEATKNNKGSEVALEFVEKAKKCK